MNQTYLIREMEMIVRKASELFCPERTGGYFCLAYKSSGLPALVAEIGEVNEEKKRKYYTFAKEKAFRLSITHTLETSWQSRNEAEDKWGGAVRCGKWIFSFSGFPELLDEAMMLVLGVRSRTINMEKAQKMANISQNPYFLKLFSALPLCSEKLVT